MLLEGDFAELERIAKQKEGLLSDTAVVSHEPADLAKIRQLSERNEKLLQASLEGVKAARSRLSDIRRASNQLETYTNAGKVRDLAHPRRQVERRA
ncbi:hypothetical protein [Tropicimonas isoalkanivorans]|nr:hypothetical protein [Tropicimonas isoalkanivorans]